MPRECKYSVSVARVSPEATKFTMESSAARTLSSNFPLAAICLSISLKGRQHVLDQAPIETQTNEHSG